MLGEVLGAQEGQLVERQRPACTGRHDKHEPAQFARGDALEEFGERSRFLRAAKSQRPRDRLAWPAAKREYQHVVCDGLAVCEQSAFPFGVDAEERAVPQLGARGLNKPVERKSAQLAHLERLGDRQWPVRELALRCDQLDRDVLTGDGIERERGL